MRCKRCGTYINENSGICIMCGSSGVPGNDLNINNDDSPEEIKTTVSYQTAQFNALKDQNRLPSYEEKKDNSYLIIYIVFGIVILSIILLAVYMYNRK